MRGKKIQLMAVLALSIMALLVAPVHAAPDWFVCSVEEVGPGGASTVYIRLTDSSAPPAFVGTWFQAKVGREKEFLAMALTAMTNNLTVRVYTDPSGSSIPARTVHNMYCLK
jgi:hypothetical protein